ncbi:MAG: heat-inducible transcriptional repressor HrcA [Clostridium sp.]|nr:heat-inducible transcriptional repressor HrcA [Clostridium sp.]MCM1444633.1 heat-inducible transcriptional repressor HrcA [Candidatus Amulumruptor caecigallinarius]
MLVLSARQIELLKLIIEDYIKTARPISSKSLCEILKCSSATVRNEMAILEDMGLIEKTHISSGRVPSEKGYRYYVDNIMKPKELTGEDVLKLQQVFQNKSLVLSDVITKSMEIVSEITNYTTVILGKSSNDNKLTKVEVVPISEHQLVAIVITDKGYVQNKNIVLEEDVSLTEIKQTVDLINKMVVGIPISEISTTLEYQVKPVIANYVKRHEVLYNAFYTAFTDFATSSNVHMNGTKNILMQPEFDNTDKIREIIRKFDDKEIINNIEEDSSGINIYIGSENDIDSDLTVIKTKYNNNGEEGTIALIGPKRMEYDHVVTLLNYIKENLK